jgi:hypothetical protein
MVLRPYFAQSYAGGALQAERYRIVEVHEHFGGIVLPEPDVEHPAAEPVRRAEQCVWEITRDFWETMQ